MHEPYVYPDDHIIMKLVPVNKEVLIPIRMTQKMCSEDAANLDPDARDCLLPHERNLKYFGKYLDDNCITECRMKHFLEYCACIPYYFPLHGKIQKFSTTLLNLKVICSLLQTIKKFAT